MGVEIRMQLNAGLYIKDPQDSDLGKKIVQHSILMIDEFGFEAFTFKKLATKIQSTEASIYRYFENKHRLLLYLVNWYWVWVNYLIEVNSRNIKDAKQRLRIIIKCIVDAAQENPCVSFVNERKLHSIIVSEGTKAYHTKEVDKENSKGFFKSYQNVVSVISDVVVELCPDFKYPHTLATNLFEIANNQTYFTIHLPNLTDTKQLQSSTAEVEAMLHYFVDRLLGL